MNESQEYEEKDRYFRLGDMFTDLELFVLHIITLGMSDEEMKSYVKGARRTSKKELHKQFLDRLNQFKGRPIDRARLLISEFMWDESE